jgi:hypothetical protein
MKPRSAHYRLKRLANYGYLSIQVAHHYSLVTIINYNLYQDDGREDCLPGCQAVAEPLLSRCLAVATIEEGKERKEQQEDAVSSKEETTPPKKAASTAGSSRTDYSFPLSGGSLFWMTTPKLDQYTATYGHLFDLPTELRKIKQWLMDNPDRRSKTGQATLRRITNWLNRACDRARTTVPGSRVAAVPDGDNVVFNPETGEFVVPLEAKKR